MSTMIRNSSTCFLMLLLAPAALADDEPTEIKSADSAAELSVAPLDHVTYAEDRPEWVSDADNGKPFTLIDGNKIVIVSRLCDTPIQCEELLMISAKVAADSYVIDLVDFVVDGSFYEFSDEELEDLITDEYQGTALQGDVKMHQHAIELTFDDDKQLEIKVASGNIEVDRRLRRMGGLFFGGLVALFGSSAVIGTAGRLGRRKVA
jgi:hypothetical protein